MNIIARLFLFCLRAKKAYLDFMEKFSVLCMSIGLWFLIIAILYFAVVGFITTFY